MSGIVRTQHGVRVALNHGPDCEGCKELRDALIGPRPTLRTWKECPTCRPEVRHVGEEM